MNDDDVTWGIMLSKRGCISASESGTAEDTKASKGVVQPPPPHPLLLFHLSDRV